MNDAVLRTTDKLTGEHKMYPERVGNRNVFVDDGRRHSVFKKKQSTPKKTKARWVSPSGGYRTFRFFIVATALTPVGNNDSQY